MDTDPVCIRGYRAGDFDALYRICLQTADNGQDAAGDVLHGNASVDSSSDTKLCLSSLGVHWAGSAGAQGTTMPGSQGGRSIRRSTLRVTGSSFAAICGIDHLKWASIMTYGTAFETPR